MQDRFGVTVADFAATEDEIERSLEGDVGVEVGRHVPVQRIVRVLAIDQTIEEKEGKSVVVGQTATLQLSPEQTRILTVAQQMSDRLTLSLRSLADSNEEVGKGATHLLSGDKGSGRVSIIRFGKKKEILSRGGHDDIVDAEQDSFVEKRRCKAQHVPDRSSLFPL